MTITLTSQQSIALDLLIDFATGEAEERMFLLEGFAGTGKSSTWWNFYERIIEDGKRYFVAVSAPTNKAVGVLAKMAPRHLRDKVEFATIHSLLGLTAEIDAEGHETFKPKKQHDKRASFAAFDIVLVDEASMINAELWGLLQEAMARYTSVKIIFMGDFAQLPPVNEEISPVFSHVSNRYALTQIVRYVADKPIGKLVGVVREWITGTEKKQSFQHILNVIALDSEWNATKSNRVYSLSDNDWVEGAIALFKSSDYEDDPDFVRCICWTNKAVNYLNTRIRNAVYGDTEMPFVEGERLICTKPVFINGELVLPTSSELTVLSCSQGYSSDQYKYKGYRLAVNEPQKDQEYYLFVLHESALEQWEARCDILKAQALKAKLATRSEAWKGFYEHRQITAPVDYAFALTAHRSQGSTFENVFVSYRDINRNSRVIERHKCLYVALTRARSAVYLCGVN